MTHTHTTRRNEKLFLKSPQKKINKKGEKKTYVYDMRLKMKSKIFVNFLERPILIE
jgi:hypothetical protein